MKKQILSIVGMLAMALTSTAGSIDFTYAGSSDAKTTWGTGKTEYYSVAIKIDNAGLNGKKVTAVNVPLVEGASYVDCGVFVSKQLKGSSGIPTADITKEFSNYNGPTKVALDEPYTIDGAFYVGYYFYIDKVTDDESKSPVQYVAKNVGNGLFVTTNRTYKKWTNMSSHNMTSTLSVVIEGDFETNAISLTSVEDKVTVPGKAEKGEAYIMNNGTTPVSSLAWTYKVNDQTTEGTVSFNPAVPADFTSSAKFEFDIPAIEGLGSYPGELTVTKVNDEAVSVKGTNTVYVMDREPVRRVVMEEFTGTWCGWCPRGWVAMKLLNEEMPDKFIGLAYHNGDIMWTMSAYPVQVGGLPGSYLDRTISCDPYFGTSEDTPMGIRNDVEARAALPVDANIDVFAEYSADGNSINVEASVYYFRDFPKNPYLLSFVVTEDGLKGDNPGLWRQSSYYPGQKGYGPEMDEWVNGKSSMEVEYDDVVLASSRYRGVVGSQPESVMSGNYYQGSYTFDCSKFTSINDSTLGTDLLQDRTKVNVIAILVNSETRQIENAAKVRLAPVSVKGVSDSVETVSTTYYDLAGRVLREAPAKGAFIEMKTLSDGSRRTAKRIR